MIPQMFFLGKAAVLLKVNEVMIFFEENTCNNLEAFDSNKKAKRTSRGEKKKNQNSRVK